MDLEQLELEDKWICKSLKSQSNNIWEKTKHACIHTKIKSTKGMLSQKILQGWGFVYKIIAAFSVFIRQ